jgi:hypothetical protein
VAYEYLRFAKQYLENLTSERVATWKLDQAGENAKSREFQQWCKEAGIVILETGVEEHESNGTIEGYWRIVTEQVRAQIISSAHDPRFWADIFCLHSEVYNSTVHAGHTKTPFEMLFG